MATTSDILTTPVTGYNYIDALLAAGPDWNFITSDGQNFRTTLYYSFDTSGSQYETKGLQAFNAAQQTAAVALLLYISQVTGISFAATSSADTADIHFALADVNNQDLGGVCYVDYAYRANADGQLTSYSADAYIYLDAVHTSDPAPVPGSWWYQALLHELGHTLGLKHPFEPTSGAEIVLKQPFSDNTLTTVMSYTQAGDYARQFGAYDLAALNALYGGDGLGGAWGVGSFGMYLTGSPLDDAVTLPNGRMTLADTGGNDTVYYTGRQQDYTITPALGGQWLDILGNGVEHRISTSVEQIMFADALMKTASLSQLPGGMIFGSDGDDIISGSAGSDLILSGSGNDTLKGYTGDDLLHGGDGLDTAVFGELAADFLVTQQNGIWTARSDVREATMISVERLQFADITMALDLNLNQAAGQAALLTAAVLGKAGLDDPVAVGQVLDVFDSGVTLQQASNAVVQTAWFQTGSGGTDAGFVRTVLQNVLGEPPSEAMQNEYLALLQGHGGNLSQAELLASVAITEANQQHINLAGLQQTGLFYL